MAPTIIVALSYSWVYESSPTLSKAELRNQRHGERLTVCEL